MSIRLKLLLTGIVMAVLVAGICIIGYITAERALTASISGEINAVLANECSQLDGYLREKGKLADATANLLEEFVDRPERLDQALVSLGSNDPEVSSARFMAYPSEEAMMSPSEETMTPSPSP